MTKLTHEHRLFLAITLAIAISVLLPAETADRALTCLNIGALVFAVRAGEGGRLNPPHSNGGAMTSTARPTWHHGVHLFGEPYPTRYPMPERFRTGDVCASELMELTEDQALAARAAHELGHALLWLAGGLHVSRVSIVPGGRRGGHAEALPTGVDDEARLRAVGTAGGERAEDRWLREAGLWTPDRAAVVEATAYSDRAYLMEHTTPRPVFGTGDGPDFALLHDMADDALDRIWGLLTLALPVLVRRRVLSGEQLAACVGLPWLSRLT